jgi:hypothetical protein
LAIGRRPGLIYHARIPDSRILSAPRHEGNGRP